MAAKQVGVVMAAKPLPPGFRFRPTDEELVVHYLRRRALSCPLPAAVDIPDIRILAHDPSELLHPGWSEPERYFFTFKEAKYVSGRRANRATMDGYWKATGKEKPVTVMAPGERSFLMGMKRSLVFYRGRAPIGSKTEWVMHEYRLADAGLAPSRLRTEPPAEGWVLCRVFRKKKSAAAADAAEENVGDEEVVVADKDEDEVEEEDATAASPKFIDFFALANTARGAQDEPPQRASSSSCLADASLELQHQQETTSSNKGA